MTRHGSPGWGSRFPLGFAADRGTRSDHDCETASGLAHADLIAPDSRLPTLI